MLDSTRITVLLVDDSAVIRGLMSQALEAYKEIDIVGRASNGEQAINLAKELLPDVIVLNIEMPVMDGLTALPELVKISPKSKIIMASALTVRNASISLQALSLGATDYLSKPTSKFGGDVDNFYRDLVTKIYGLSNRPLPVAVSASVHASAPVVAPAASNPSAAAPRVAPMIVGGRLNPMGLHALAIASSTGGPQALMQFFGQVKGQLMGVPIFITQHMPPTFTTILAEQIGKVCGHAAKEGANGEEVKNGTIYIAPGDYHMIVEKQDGKVMIRTNQQPAENFCRPAADPMLRALSQVYGSHLVVVVMTGMGQDGMEGAKEVVAKGGSVISQDEASCVVYGMPRAVAEQGLCKVVLPLAELAPFVVSQIEGRR